MVSVDVKKINDEYIVFSNNGQVQTKYKVVEWSQRLEKLGAGEILIRSIDMDGTSRGYDLELVKLISDNINIATIASGGVGEFKHLAEGIRAGAHAVSVGNIFHFLGESLIKAKEYLVAEGLRSTKSKWNFSIREYA